MAKIVDKFVRSLKRNILRDEFLLAHKEWKRVHGDVTYRMDYELDSNSIVFDVGGFDGDFAESISRKFGSKIFIFEPDEAKFRACEARFADDPNISVFNFGLSSADPASTSKNDASQLSQLLHKLSLKHVDLMTLNFSGADLPCLSSMIKEGEIGKVLNLQIQFYDFVPNAKELREEIRQALSLTHEEQWCFPFVWESWRLK